MPRTRLLPFVIGSNAMENMGVQIRIIELGIHRSFAEAMVLDERVLRRLGKIGMTREQLAAFAETLNETDHVVIAAIGNATALVDVLEPQVARVAVANPLQVHLIAKAKTRPS